MPEQDEQVESEKELLSSEVLEEEDPTRWGLEQGDEIVPGRYALKRLGGGYDYEAYLAWDDDLMAVVVAKCLRPHLVSNPHSLKALRREATHLMRLHHPVVVRGFDAVLEGERPHVVMEFLEGPNLSRLLRRYGPVDLAQLLPLALQICSAVHYLGTRRIVHLDIKPRNIIMGAPPRLIDLSIARTFDEAGKITGQVGTDAYMAPEQCDPSGGTPGPASDVWGLGATLHHAIACGVPFPRPDYDRDNDQDNLSVRFPQLTVDPAPLPTGVPEPLRDALAACLTKDPAERPSAAELVTALEPLVTSMPSKPVLRKARPGRRA